MYLEKHIPSLEIKFVVPRWRGKLGITKLRKMSIWLLAKLGWRILKDPTTLRARILWSKYGDPLSPVQKRGNVSQIWRGVLAGSDVLKEGPQRSEECG